ncbi:MAG: histidine kinase [Eubacteriales bacterium]|nr:histidine kinase [Eubacteriales bacterium]
MKKMISWYLYSASIRKKLTISYLVLILVPLLILGVYSYRLSYDNLMEQTRATMISNVQSISSALNNNIQRENENIRYFAYNSDLRDTLRHALEDQSSLALTLNNMVEPTLWYFITSDDNIKFISIYSPYVAQSMGDFVFPITEEKDRIWYEQHQNDFKTQWIYEEDGISAYRVLLDANTSSQPIGFIKIQIQPENFLDTIFQTSYLENGIVLVDAENNEISGTSILDTEVDLQTRKYFAKLEPMTLYEDDRILLLSSDILLNEWKFYYYIDKSEISTQLYEIYQSTAMIMGLCGILILLLVGLLSHMLSSRILTLKKYAEEVSKGNLHPAMSVKSEDEIGIVVQSFHNMANRIDQMIQENYELGKAKRAEELKVLQAKINPHFLYNCLSSIKWKAIRNNQDEIGEITGLLAKFYRTALNDGRQVTTVKNELENITAYIELQLRTHDNSFDVVYDFSEDGQNLEIPNFLLQPIVENAIQHGIEYCEMGVRGLIKIVYCHEENYLVFSIYNNGPILGQEEVRKILENPNGGYGLYNVQERIHMRYDTSCGVFSDITKNNMIGFIVKLRDTLKE